MEHYGGPYEHEVSQEVIDNLAQGVINLAPLLRGMNAADSQSWMRLHLRLMELGPLVYTEVSILQQLVQGLIPNGSAEQP